MFLINPDDVAAYLPKNSPKNSEAFRFSLNALLKQLMITPHKICYSDAFPEGTSRFVMGKCLGALWEYCNDNYLPWLNMLVVSKAYGLPSTGVQSWYAEQFGDLTGYDKFCRHHAEIASMAIAQGIIDIKKRAA